MKKKFASPCPPLAYAGNHHTQTVFVVPGHISATSSESRKPHFQVSLNTDNPVFRTLQSKVNVLNAHGTHGGFNCILVFSVSTDKARQLTRNYLGKKVEIVFHISKSFFRRRLQAKILQVLLTNESVN